MVQSIVNEISPSITGLNFVERYGGLVQTIGIYQESGETKYYPISCSVNEQDCRNNQRYQDLIPDSSKSSVVYFEQMSDLADRGFATFGQRQSDTFRNFEVRLRLVCWLNLGKLGLVNCNAADGAQRVFFNLLCKKIEPTDPVFSPNSEIEIKNIAVVKKDKGVFDPYEYPLHALLYPYDFFAIDFTVKLMTCIGVDYDLPIGSPIECIDYTKT